jgi:hypothetical protein
MHKLFAFTELLSRRIPRKTEFVGLADRTHHHEMRSRDSLYTHDVHTTEETTEKCKSNELRNEDVVPQSTDKTINQLVGCHTVNGANVFMERRSIDALREEQDGTLTYLAIFFLQWGIQSAS